MRVSDFDYELPSDLIAQFPLEKRGDSRLLCMDGVTGAIEDRRFSELAQLLCPGDLLVLNDTRVMPARLIGRKETGGKAEVLIERLLSTHRALAHIRASKTPRPGTSIRIGSRAVLDVGQRRGDLFEVVMKSGDFSTLMEAEGHMPLPPYIARQDSDFDRERYQTVYAKRPGAVAAPTAGLHFEREMLDRLAARGVETGWITLHVGAGTFQPVRVENLDEQRMHSEYVEVDPLICRQISETRARGGRLVAVGTTSVRSLESAAVEGRVQPFRGETRLFIRPGYAFSVVDALITNFHLPKSTLLMLVSAFGGYEQVLAAYRHAVANRYRFFSYGDAMFLTRRSDAG